jgi:hypothetical protein
MLAKMKSIVFFLIFFTSAILADAPIRTTSVDLEILDYTFNLELDKAFTLTNEQIQNNGTSPKYYFFYVNAMMMEYGVKLNESRVSSRDIVKEKLIQSIIDYCENVNEKFEDAELTKEEKFYYAGVLGYLARSYGLNRSWWNAFQTGQEAESLMEEIIEEDPEFYDAYLMLGMFQYFADRMSGITSLIASILGLSGDRDTGLKYIHLAYEKGSPATFGQASLMLIEIYTRMEENSFASINFFESFLEKYPRNYRIISWYGRELVSTWKFEKAKRLIDKDTLDLVDANVKALYYNGIGDCENAVKYSKIVLQNKNTHYRWITRNNESIYLLNNWLLGNYDEVERFKMETDDNQGKWIDELDEYPEEFRWLASFSSAIARGEPKNYMDSFFINPPEFKLKKNNYKRYYYSGIYYYGIGDIGNAESYFIKAKAGKDSWIVYDALKYLVEIYIQYPTDTKKVEVLIEEINDLENDRLSFRVKELSLLYKLN